MFEGWWWVGILPGVLIGSCGGSVFTCEDDAGCNGLSEGACEPLGYCSIPDSECGSGRRYAPGSGELSDLCVPGGGSTGLVEGSSGSSDGDSDTDRPPLDDSGGTTTDGSTATTDVDTATSGSDSGGTTTDGPAFGPCQDSTLLLLDTFDDPGIDRAWWELYVDGPIMLAPSEGALVATVDDVTGDRTAYSDLRTRDPLPPVGSAGVEVLEIPDPMLPATESYLTIGDESIVFGMDFYQGDILIYENYGVYTVRTTVPFDPNAHRWVRLAFDQGLDRLVWQASADGERWDELDVLEGLPDGWLASAGIEIGAGVWQGLVPSQVIGVFDNAFVCGQ